MSENSPLIDDDGLVPCARCEGAGFLGGGLEICPECDGYGECETLESALERGVEWIFDPDMGDR